MRAESAVRRRVAADLEREGISAAGFSVLVVLTTAGGRLELRTIRRRLGWSKANATEVTLTLQGRGLITRAIDASDRRARVLSTTPAGEALVAHVFPEHTQRVAAAFADLDDEEKRILTQVCRKLAA